MARGSTKSVEVFEVVSELSPDPGGTDPGGCLRFNKFSSCCSIAGSFAMDCNISWFGSDWVDVNAVPFGSLGRIYEVS